MSNALLFLSKIFNRRRRVTHKATASPPLHPADEETISEVDSNDFEISQHTETKEDVSYIPYTTLQLFQFPDGGGKLTPSPSEDTCITTEPSTGEEVAKYEHLSPFDRVMASVQEHYKSPLDKQTSWYDSRHLVPVVPEKELNDISKQVCSLSMSTPEVIGKKTLKSKGESSLYSGSYTSRTQQSSNKNYEIVGVLNKNFPHILLARQKIKKSGRVIDTRIVVIKRSREEESSKHGRPPVNSFVESHIMIALSDQILKTQAGYDYLVHYIDHFSIQSGGRLEVNLVMQYCEFGSFADFLENSNLLPPNILRQITKDATMGILFMHSIKIAHRDVKPENMYLTFDQTKNRVILKYGDFGFATILQNESIQERIVPGTLDFAAPELLYEQPRDLFACDIWALGVSFFNMLEGRPLFPTDRYRDDPFKGRSLIKDDIRRPFTDQEEYRSLRLLINSMTDVDPMKRDNIYDVVGSTWINGDCEPLSLKMFGDYHLSK